jgi:hypothetical protein
MIGVTAYKGDGRILELLDLLTDGLRRHQEFLSRSANAAVLGDGLEYPERIK